MYDDVRSNIELDQIHLCQILIFQTAALTHDIGIHVCEEKYGNCNGKLQEKEGPAIAKKLFENGMISF